MLINTLTIEELERIAYIKGYTKAASLLVRIDDLVRDLDQAEHDYGNALTEIDTLTEQIRALS